MALPGGVTPITVTGTVANNKGVPATGGTVTFRMPYALSDGTDHVVLAPGTWSFTIGSDGTINTASDPMPAATSTGVSPAGWSYDVTVRAVLADASVWFRRFYVQISANTSFEQLLAASAPTPAPPAVFVPLSAVGQTVAPLVSGKVPAQYLPPDGGGSGLVDITALNGTIIIDETDPFSPAIGVGTGIPQDSVSGLTSRLGQNDDDVTAAANAAAGAATAAATAVSAANAAQATANAAYVKPGGGIPDADLAAAVQDLLALASTAVQALPPVLDLGAARDGGHSCNVPGREANALSTINGEVWAALIPVEAGNAINGAYCFLSDATTGVFNGSTGLNGFAAYPEAGGALIASSVNDDLMWQAPGKVDKALSGVPTPSVRTSYWVLMSVRNYSTSPTFNFKNFGSNGAHLLAERFGRYKGGGFGAGQPWPATLNPAVGGDLATGQGYVLPIGLRS